MDFEKRGSLKPALRENGDGDKTTNTLKRQGSLVTTTHIKLPTTNFENQCNRKKLLQTK
jgi:hypothetical protein